MTKLVWDKSGQRLFEAGLDRGVLYLEDTTGVAWNGLISVDEDMSSADTTPRYFDGIKILDEPSIGDYKANLKAFTYPDEFLEYDGIQALGEGFYVDDQPNKLFGLSYRTKIGNDISGMDLGYKVHLVYNLLASPQPSTYETLSDGTTALAFSWDLSAIPVIIPDYRPTAHVILDSRDLPADMLNAIETILYGGDGVSTGMMVYDGGSPSSSGPSLIDGGGPGDIGEELPGEGYTTGDPRLPSIAELFDIITFWGPRIIIPDTITGLADLIPGFGDLTVTNRPGIFTALAETRLLQTGIDGIYELVT